MQGGQEEAEAVAAPQHLQCPSCGGQAARQETRYGRRDACDPCGLWSWDGKELVSAEVHRARKFCHAEFDPLWQRAPEVYEIHEPEGTPERARAEKHIRKAARGRACAWIAAQTGLPERECHMSTQADIGKLRRIYAAARSCPGPQAIRDWSREQETEEAA